MPPGAKLLDVLFVAAGAVKGLDAMSTLLRKSPARLDAAVWFLALLLAVVPLLLGEPELWGSIAPEVVLRTCRKLLR